MDEETYQLTDKGMKIVLDMHDKLANNWSIELVAEYFGRTVEEVRVLLAMLYHAAEQHGVQLNDVPDSLGN